MFWTLSITLLVMWLLGMVSGYTFGGFIHLLLIVAIGLAVAAIIRTRVAASGPESTTAGGRPGEDARIDTIVRSSGASAVAPSQAKTGRAIFLSYRRDDSADVVGRIYDRLIQRFGEAPALPGEDQLPGSLGPLAFRNGIAVRVDPDFHKDMDRLIAGLESLM